MCAMPNPFAVFQRQDSRRSMSYESRHIIHTVPSEVQLDNKTGSSNTCFLVGMAP